MLDVMNVVIGKANLSEAPILANLFELYLHDFSEVEPASICIGPDGRYSPPDALARYWHDPQRHPFLIRTDGQLAGFALVKRGLPMTGDLNAMDLAEFFVLRPYRRHGAGPWVLRVLAQHTAALSFWLRTIADYTEGRYIQDAIRQVEYAPPREWIVFRFKSNRH